MKSSTSYTLYYSILFDKLESCKYYLMAPCRVIGDTIPNCGDCIFDHFDFAELTNHWFEASNSSNWYLQYDIAPAANPDGKVDFLDLALLAKNWLEGFEP